MSRSDNPLVHITPFKILLLGLILCILMLASGCKLSQVKEVIPADPPEPQVETYSSPFREVKSPVSLNFLSVNRLREHYKETSDSSGYREMKMTIAGLVEKETEALINEQINEMHERVKEIDLPPYRGIKRRITDDFKLIDKYLSTSLTFNYNNIISISTSGSKIFALNDTEAGEFIEYMEVLNLDLNTGKEIRLSDLFVNDVNYKDIINTKIQYYLDKDFSSEEYSDNFGYLKLIAPFKGVREHQKFMLSENAIILIFDHETPEFENGLTYSRINIPFNDVIDSLAIGERFISDKELYDNKPFGTNTTSSKILISHYYKYMTGERTQKTVRSIDIYSEYQYPPSVSQELQEYFALFRELDEKEIEALSRSERKSQYYQDAYVSVIGEYTIFTKSINISNEGASKFDMIYAVYNGDNELMSLDDIFTEDFDYKDYLTKILSIEVPYQQKPVIGDIDDLLEGMTFRLNSNGIYFSTIPVKFSDNEIHPVTFSVDYDRFGYENLMIFD